MLLWRALIASVNFFWECRRYWIMSWVNLNSFANPGGKLCTSCWTTSLLSSVFSTQFFSLNSSSRLQNAIPGKMSCSILLSVIPSFSNSSTLIPAAKWIWYLDPYSYSMILCSFSRYSVSDILSIVFFKFRCNLKCNLIQIVS